MEFLSRAEKRRHDYLEQKHGDDDYCGHCGRLLVGPQCRVHGTPETTVGFEDAWRIEQEERSGYDG